MKKPIIYSFLFIFAASVAPSLVAADELYAEDAYMRAMPPGQQVTSAFLRLVNSSDQACRITGGSSPIATKLEIHEHQHSDGMMRMRPVASVTVEAGQSLTFKSGQLHLMLLGIQTPLIPGQIQEITLTTEGCGSLVVAAEVRSLFKAKSTHSMHGDKMNSKNMGGNSK